MFLLDETGIAVPGRTPQTPMLPPPGVIFSILFHVNLIKLSKRSRKGDLIVTLNCHSGGGGGGLSWLSLVEGPTQRCPPRGPLCRGC